MTQKKIRPKPNATASPSTLQPRLTEHELKEHRAKTSANILRGLQEAADKAKAKKAAQSSTHDNQVHIGKLPR